MTIIEKVARKMWEGDRHTLSWDASGNESVHAIYLRLASIAVKTITEEMRGRKK